MSGIPFRAALFDLDGTLLDSMYVWHRVDEIFFSKRGMSIPKDYGRQVAGLSYRETAEFTVRNYLPGEKWEDLVEEWTQLCRIEYTEHVPLKPGSRRYLRLLRRHGVKLAVATALPEHLFRPCLQRLGVLDLFDAHCSTDHTGGASKHTGEVYRMAARMLGVVPEECAVFEDVLGGIAGAKRAGMRAYCVKDPSAAAEYAAMAEIADGMLDTLDDMRAFHDFDDPRCVIFTARCEGDPRAAWRAEPDDFVLCADAGWKTARDVGAVPALVIGDFDSADAPQGVPVERHPVEKDDSDTMLCLKRGLHEGYSRFLFVGGFGGRLDHTVANLQTLAYAASMEARADMDDGATFATVLRGGESRRFARRAGTLSVFSLSERCEGVTLSGVKYPLSDGALTSEFPLGLSNSFTADEAEVSVREGTLLVVCAPPDAG